VVTGTSGSCGIPMLAWIGYGEQRYVEGFASVNRGAEKYDLKADARLESYLFCDPKWSLGVDFQVKRY